VFHLSTIADSFLELANYHVTYVISPGEHFKGTPRIGITDRRNTYIESYGNRAIGARLMFEKRGGARTSLCHFRTDVQRISCIAVESEFCQCESAEEHV
jgi:hypothetical protein